MDRIKKYGVRHLLSIILSLCIGLAVMPAMAVHANYESDVTVINGRPGGAYFGGDIVTIWANEPEPGKKFKAWSSKSRSVRFADKSSPQTTFVMPHGFNVTVEALYEDIIYPVTVVGGSANKTGYKIHETVIINANDPPEGQEFDGWTITGLRGVFLDDEAMPQTSFLMPAKPIELTATYKNVAQATLSSIAITKPATKLEYKVGEALDITGMEITGSYSDSTTKSEKITPANVTGFDSSRPAESQMLTVTLDGKTASYAVKIKAVKAPTFTVNMRGDGSGATGAGSYSKGASINIYAGSRNDYTFDGWTSSDVSITNASDKNASFTMPDKDVTVTANWRKNDPILPNLTEQEKLEKEKLEQEKLEKEKENEKLGKEKEPLEKEKLEKEKELKWVNPFADVREDSWFYGPVKYVYQNDLMKGTKDNTFGANEATTRGMIVTILYRLEGSPLVGANKFSDVKTGKYYEKAVAWASENKIVSGYGNDKFGPDNSITREQLAAILMNHASYKGYGVAARADLSKFEDSKKVSNWAKDAISWANAEGLIRGDGSNLTPTGHATRAQVAAILNRFIEEIAKQ